jgi:hypothetical protein
MGHSKVEATKNIYGHLSAQDQASVLAAINQAVSRLYAYETAEPRAGRTKMRLPDYPLLGRGPTDGSGGQCCIRPLPGKTCHVQAGWGRVESASRAEPRAGDSQARALALLPQLTGPITTTEGAGEVFQPTTALACGR